MADLCRDGWARLVTLLHRYGVAVVLAEGPGNILTLAPLWAEAGFDGIQYGEVASGVDGRELRRRWGGPMALVGNIDERVLHRAEREVAAEVYDRVVPLLEQGRYIPAPDRVVSAGVPLRNFEYLLDVLRSLGVPASSAAE